MLSTHSILFISGPPGMGRSRAGGLAACADVSRAQEGSDRAGNQVGPRASKESPAGTGQGGPRPQGCFLTGLKAALEAEGRSPPAPVERGLLAFLASRLRHPHPFSLHFAAPLAPPLSTRACLVAQTVKNLSAVQETQG